MHPCLVSKNTYIGNVNGVMNAVITEGEPVGETVLQGEGAGPGPTSSALMSDLLSILRGNIKYPFTISNARRKNKVFKNINNEKFSSYLRIEVIDKHGVLSDITKTLAKNKVSIKRLIQNPYKSKKYASIIIITHESKNISLVKVIKALSKKKYIVKKPKFLRIENI